MKPYIQEATCLGLDDSMPLQKFVGHNTGVKVIRHKEIGENAYGKAE